MKISSSKHKKIVDINTTVYYNGRYAINCPPRAYFRVPDGDIEVTVDTPMEWKYADVDIT